MHIRKAPISQIHLGRRLGGRHLGAKLLAGLVLIGSAAATSEAAEAAKPVNRPLVFEHNRGQAAREVKWLARGPGHQLLFTADALTIALPDHAPAPTRSGSQKAPSLLPRLPFASPAESPVSLFRMKLHGSHAWNAADGLELFCHEVNQAAPLSMYIASDSSAIRKDRRREPRFDAIHVGALKLLDQSLPSRSHRMWLRTCLPPDGACSASGCDGQIANREGETSNERA